MLPAAIRFLACLFLAASPLCATLPGIHAPFGVARAQADGAEVVRLLPWGMWLPVTISNHERGVALEKNPFHLMEQYHRAGMKVVITTHFWTREREPLPEEGSALWKRHVEYFGIFLERYGSNLYQVGLDNEPQWNTADVDFETVEGKPRIIRFYEALARKAHEVKEKSAGGIRVRVASPGIFGFGSMQRGTMKEAERLKVACVWDWAVRDPHIDVVDLHVHTDGIPDAEAVFAWARSNTIKPLSCTEWSQSGVCQGLGRKPLDDDFRARWGVPKMSGFQYVARCHSNRVSSGQWNDFISRAGFDPDFMNRFMAAATRAGIDFICYAQHGQYRHVLFDMQPLVANLTVLPRADGEAEDNGPLAAWHRAMVAKWKNGDFGGTGPLSR